MLAVRAAGSARTMDLRARIARQRRLLPAAARRYQGKERHLPLHGRGPSQVDTLIRHSCGLTASRYPTARHPASRGGVDRSFASPHRFARHGERHPVSESLASRRGVDDLSYCAVAGMTARSLSRDRHHRHAISDRPSLGVGACLGGDQNLPGFIVMRRARQIGRSRGRRFLPQRHQAAIVRRPDSACRPAAGS